LSSVNNDHWVVQYTLTIPLPVNMCMSVLVEGMNTKFINQNHYDLLLVQS